MEPRRKLRLRSNRLTNWSSNWIIFGRVPECIFVCLEVVRERPGYPNRAKMRCATNEWLWYHLSVCLPQPMVGPAWPSRWSAQPMVGLRSPGHKSSLLTRRRFGVRGHVVPTGDSRPPLLSSFILFVDGSCCCVSLAKVCYVTKTAYT